MPKFMIIWLGGFGDGLVYGGNPAGMSSTVFVDRDEESGGANPVSGYTHCQCGGQGGGGEDCVGLSDPRRWRQRRG